MMHEKAYACTVWGMTATLLATMVALAAAAPAPRPNVVIFYADDMGIGDVGCYGCPDIATPNLDALAAAGVRFTNYYSAAPVCSPSRAALMTGRYPQRAGVPSNCSSTPGAPGMPATQITIAEVAKSAGYATGLVGKWHLGFSPETVPNAQGFDFFFGHHAGCIDYYSHMFYWQAPHHHDLYRNREEVHEEGAYMTDVIQREAERFIDQHAKEPFLLYVAFNAPHYPLQAPEPLRKAYANLPEPRRHYAPLVAGLDAAVGRIVGRLAREGLTENTLMFFASDNGATTEARGNYGGGSNAPYRGHKFSLFEGGIHMPAILAWPGHTPAGQTRDQLACAIDLLPTVAEAIGAKLPEGHAIDGQTWRQLLSDPAAPGHEVLYWSQGGQQAIREARYKLLRKANEHNAERPGSRPAPVDEVFLADLQADPRESTNFAAAQPEVVRRLSERHRIWSKSLER